MIDLKEIVMKLNGPIEPVGESHTDEVRLNNLKNLCDLVEDLVGEIQQICPNKDRVEYSMKEAGKYAHAFLYKRLGIEE